MTTIIFSDATGTDYVVEAVDGQSVMQAAVRHDLPGILGECGGCMSCGTCHCYVDEDWADRLLQPNETEAVMIDCVEQPRPTSRLSCQIRVMPELDGLRVEIPNVKS